MKSLNTIALLASLVVVSPAAFCGESAAIVGIMNTSGTVDVDGFRSPREIWTRYVPNDPAESNTLLMYVAHKQLGEHTVYVEYFDKNKNKIDTCEYNPTTVDKLPFINTLTCKWGGRLPSGGLNFMVYNTLKGKKEKIGEMYLPSVK